MYFSAYLKVFRRVVFLGNYRCSNSFRKGTENSNIEMDVLELIIFSVVSAIVTAILPYVIPVIASLTLYKRAVRGSSQVRQLDTLIHKNGHVSALVTEGNEVKPADGWHLVEYRWFPILAIRRTITDTSGRSSDRSEYVLYCIFRTGIEYILEAGKNPQSVTVLRFESLMPWNTTTTTFNLIPPGVALNINQQKACSACLEKFRDTGKCSILLVGEPGGGKSATALYLAAALQRIDYSPIVLLGFDMTCKGASALRLLPAEIPDNTPYILVLDEVDSAFKMAMAAEEGKTEVSCLARSKTSLCNELDRLASVPNLIVIGTTNVSIDDLQKDYSAFVRKGRFDILVDKF